MPMSCRPCILLPLLVLRRGADTALKHFGNAQGAFPARIDTEGQALRCPVCTLEELDSHGTARTLLMCRAQMKICFEMNPMVPERWRTRGILQRCDIPGNTANFRKPTNLHIRKRYSTRVVLRPFLDIPCCWFSCHGESLPSIATPAIRSDSQDPRTSCISPGTRRACNLRSSRLEFAWLKAPDTSEL